MLKGDRLYINELRISLSQVGDFDPLSYRVVIPTELLRIYKSSPNTGTLVAILELCLYAKRSAAPFFSHITTLLVEYTLIEL